VTGPVSQALSDFCASPAAEHWRELPFFTDGTADDVAARVDARIAAGAQVLPSPENVFNGLRMTRFETVKAVVLGQDPYPTPGVSHGLAFSYVGPDRPPASLKVILAEMGADCGVPLPRTGNLAPWTEQGVLLLNTALTVEAGASGAHMKIGWSALADQAVAAISAQRPAVVFLLWGGPARRRAELIDRDKHLVLECGHPSPLNRLNDFRGTRPFSRANEWLTRKGVDPVNWALP